MKIKTAGQARQLSKKGLRKNKKKLLKAIKDNIDFAAQSGKTRVTISFLNTALSGEPIESYIKMLQSLGYTVNELQYDCIEVEWR